MSKAKAFLIQSTVWESEDVKSYRLRYGEQRLRFEAGQFVLVQLGPNGPKAPLTLSSSNLDEDGFEFTLKKTGEFGTHFIENAKVGDLISVIGPSGRFCLPTEGREDICFIGRDYTVSAARSYFRSMSLLCKESGRASQRRFFLIHELSSAKQNIFDKDFEEHVPSFKRVTILDGKPQTDWEGALGQVTSEVIKSTVSSLSSTRFFVCGEGIEIKRFKNVLAELELSEEQLFFDRWS